MVLDFLKFDEFNLKSLIMSLNNIMGMMHSFDYYYNQTINHNNLSVIADITEQQGVIENFLNEFDDERQIFDKFKEKYDDFEILKNISSHTDISFFSFINFVRYQTFFKRFISLPHQINWNNKILSITFNTENQYSTNLQLIFQENGIVRFLSLDRDEDNEDSRLSYAIDGTFSSSEFLDKSHKIEYLVAILDKILFSKKLENLMVHKKENYLKADTTNLYLSNQYLNKVLIFDNSD